MYTAVLYRQSFIGSFCQEIIMSNEEKEKKERVLEELKEALKGVREVSMEDLEKIYAGAADPSTMSS